MALDKWLRNLLAHSDVCGSLRRNILDFVVDVCDADLRGIEDNGMFSISLHIDNRIGRGRRSYKMLVFLELEECTLGSERYMHPTFGILSKLFAIVTLLVSLSGGWFQETYQGWIFRAQSLMRYGFASGASLAAAIRAFDFERLNVGIAEELRAVLIVAIDPG